MMRTVLFTLLMLFSGAAFACDTLYLGLVSHHWDQEEKDYNQKHHGIGCSNAFGKWDVLYFRNSNRRDSFFMLNYKETHRFGRLSLGFDYGAGTGYGWPITPVALPKAKYDFGSFSLNGWILLTEGVALQLEFDL